MTTRTKPVLILISGKRYSGKDVLAASIDNELCQLGFRVVIRSTALSLKTRFCKEYGLDLASFLNDRAYKESYRDRLTKFTLNHSQEENIKSFIESLDPDLNTNDFIILSDLRTKLDTKAIRSKFKALTIRVSADDKVRTARGYKESQYDTSLFETDLDNENFDFYITNESSLEELNKKARLLAEEIASRLLPSLRIRSH